MSAEWYNIFLSWKDLIAAALQLLAFLTALSALRITYKHNRAKERPILAILLKDSATEKGIYLINNGIGLAVITKVYFVSGQLTGSSMSELYDFSHIVGPDKDVDWDDCSLFRIFPQYLRPGSSTTILKMTAEELNKHHVKRMTEAILNDWRSQTRKIKVRIEYKDIFGSLMPSYVRDLEGSFIGRRDQFSLKNDA